MRKRNIQQSNSIDQAQEGTVITRKAFVSYIHSLIRENAVYKNNGLRLLVEDLPEYDIKILLSHVLSAEDYEHMCQSASMTDGYFLENQKYLQLLIDNEIDEVYLSAMNEMGVHFDRYPDNGELYPIRRAS